MKDFQIRDFCILSKRKQRYVIYRLHFNSQTKSVPKLKYQRCHGRVEILEMYSNLKYLFRIKKYKPRLVSTKFNLALDVTKFFSVLGFNKNTYFITYERYTFRLLFDTFRYCIIALSFFAVLKNRKVFINFGAPNLNFSSV